MLEIIMHILAVIGIVLLALLAFVLIAVALVLFFPVSYRIFGEKDEEGLRAAAKAGWLFGLVRASYRYPEPGRVIVKVLMFTVYDSKTAAEKKQDEKSTKKGKGKKKNTAKTAEKSEKTKAADAAESAGAESSGRVVPDAVSGKETDRINAGKADALSGGEGTGGAEDTVREEIDGGKGILSEGKEMYSAGGDDLTGEKDAAETGEDSEQSSQTENSEASGGRISQKIEKIQYTIHNIYDKIKGIWENISYYAKLLQEEDTKQLLSYAVGKLAVILRHLRPKRISADILFGTGSPDTTGYVYGAYCMLSGAWGGEIVVTPDFERQIFMGRFEARGHITVWTLAINVLKVVLDKRLQVFIAKLKAGKGRGSSK